MAARLGDAATAARNRSRWLGIVVGALAVLVARPLAAAEFTLAPGQTVIGKLSRYTIRSGDVFADIARRFDVGYTALVTANPGVDPWVPAPGTEITIPSLYVLPDAPRRGIVLNLSQYRMFYFPPGESRVLTYPIGVGVIGWKTPLGATRIVRKEPNPVWYPPPSIRAQRPELPAMVPAGPDNPLGAFALRLGWPNFLIHGTNKPDGIGRNVSHGCIHLYPEDIAQLFALARVGTAVRTVEQPATAGWDSNRLVVEVYPSQAQTEEIDTERPVTPEPAQGVRAVVGKAAGQYAGTVDWNAVDRAASERTGMPIGVGEAAAVADNAGPTPEVIATLAPPSRDTATQAFDRLLDELIAHKPQSAGEADANR